MAEGISHPSVEAQYDLMKTAINNAKISPSAVYYAEAHGTGTAVGDPIEARSISSAYCSEKRTSPLFIGSSKSNIGHGESVAGVVGFIKAALCVEKGKLVPSLRFSANPKIPFEEYQLQVVTKLQDWPQPSENRLAAINSFGFGGSNCHIIIQGYKPTLSIETPNHNLLRVVPISAKSLESLNLNCKALKKFIGENRAKIRLDDISYTLSETREHHSYRVAFQVSNLEELEKGLQDYVDNTANPIFINGTTSNRKLAFVFTGMGAQWPSMGRELFESDAAFSEAVQLFDESFKKISGWSIVQLLKLPNTEWDLEKTSISQAMIVAVQIGILKSLQKRGITPGVVVGHSVGELAAAYAGGMKENDFNL